MGKVLSKNELLAEISELKNDNKTVVTTNGCFDILHVGHVRYLAQAKNEGDILVIALNSDSSVRGLKGPTRPVNKEEDRAEVLANLLSVDYVVLFNESTPESLLADIKPDIHVKGGDYDINNLPEAKVIHENGGKVVFMPMVEGKSTTNIINKVKN
ncbi:MAG: D-glycero-beta-D-manno-heptose 1-phosphate adenylyltransferase [bacterium]